MLCILANCFEQVSILLTNPGLDQLTSLDINCSTSGIYYVYLCINLIPISYIIFSLRVVLSFSSKEITKYFWWDIFKFFYILHLLDGSRPRSLLFFVYFLNLKSVFYLHWLSIFSKRAKCFTSFIFVYCLFSFSIHLDLPISHLQSL